MRIRPAATALLVLLLLAACSAPAPVVRQRRYSAPGAATRLMAVVPFYPRPMLARSAGQSGLSSAEAAEFVTRFLTEAMIEQGFEMVPASDVQLAFENNGMLIPRLEPKLAAEFTAKEFGASGVLLGEVLRYRDRVDDAMRSERGASVSFLVTLYAAPGGAKLWSAQFEETQRSITADPLRARHYPGGGTRWMSVAEFSRWGASELAEKLRLAR